MAENEHSNDASQDAIERVIKNFVKGLPARMEALRSAITSVDWDSAQHLSHKLAGAAIFGFPELGAVAHRLENAIDDGETNSVPNLLAELETVVSLVEQGKMRGDALSLLR